MIQKLFKPNSINSSIWLIFFLTITILTIFTSVLLWNINVIQEVNRESQRTEKITETLNSLMRDLLNAETGQRGYLLTVDDNYLVPYHAGSSQINDDFQRLNGLVENTNPLNLLGKLKFITDAKLAELDKTIQLASKGRRDEALSLVRSNIGKERMDEIRQLIDSKIKLEDDLLAKRRAEFINKQHKLIIILLTGWAITIAILLFLTIRTIRRLGIPITELKNGLYAMAKGELNHEIRSFTDDEIGDISKSANETRKNLLALQQTQYSILKELQRSNEDLDNFAYVASHDLKAPLRGIRNLAEWIFEDTQNIASKDTRENLLLLRNRVDRLDGLLESLLAYSRVGRKFISAETVDSGKLVNEIRDYLARSDFTIVCTESMPTLITPKAPLELVLRNLINNAIKHHDREQGHISVSARKLGVEIEFRVEDDGPGIASEFHEKVFQMFQTLKPRDQVEGSGMGLAIVLKTVESLGGSIRVESNPPERGTAFIFLWPQSFNKS